MRDPCFFRTMGTSCTSEISGSSKGPQPPTRRRECGPLGARCAHKAVNKLGVNNSPRIIFFAPRAQVSPAPEFNPKISALDQCGEKGAREPFFGRNSSEDPPTQRDVPEPVLFIGFGGIMHPHMPMPPLRNWRFRPSA